MKTPGEDQNVTKSANSAEEKDANSQPKQASNQNWDEHMQIDEEGNEVGPDDQV